MWKPKCLAGSSIVGFRKTSMRISHTQHCCIVGFVRVKLLSHYLRHLDFFTLMSLALGYWNLCEDQPHFNNTATILPPEPKNFGFPIITTCHTWALLRWRFTHRTFLSIDQVWRRSTALAWSRLLLACAKSRTLSARRRQPHLLHISAVERRQTWSMDKSWRCDIVWISPQSHSSLSVIPRFLWHELQWPWPVRKRFSSDHWSRWGCRRLADNIWLLAHDSNNTTKRRNIKCMYLYLYC